MKTSLSTHGKTLRMVQIALLMALEVVLTLLYIPVGTINLNFGLVPIVIAAIFLGPIAGALIGYSGSYCSQLFLYFFSYSQPCGCLWNQCS